MKVRARLLLHGAVVPSVGMLVAIVLAGQLFRLSLVRALDQALRSQAAVESVSLFDGPRGEPHLYPTPTQTEAARAFRLQGVVAVYDQMGAPVIHFPEGAHVPRSLRPGSSHAPPELNTVEIDGQAVRELQLTVGARDGRSYLLWLASPLSSVVATTRTFYRVTLGMCAMMALFLFVVEGLESQRLAGRIRAMTAHLPRLREGDFGSRIPRDTAGDEIAALRDALAEVSERLAAARDAQDRLIANAAHELRTPLTVMRTEMDLALRRERSPAELREALRGTRQEVDRLADLATRLLDLAAQGRGGLELRPGDLSALCRSSVEAFHAEAETRGLKLALDAPAHAECWFDPAGVRQAVDNYLSNALKFAPTGSRVDVRLKPLDGRYAIEVADEGPGVPAELRETVFEPFFRASKAGSGAGLGLAIVREIARRHGGWAWVVEARPEAGGARFVLELPTNRPATEQAAAARAS